MTVEKKLPVTVCLIAANEAHRIRRALASMVDWAGEIIVVLNDDVSDGTDQIAAEFGAKVFREPWKGFIGQKNSAAAKATQPWLLNLDADEEVSPGLRRELQKLFAAPEKVSAFAAFSLPRCTFYCGRWIRHGDWYPDRKIQLWRRGQGRWGGVEPHAALAVEGRVGRLAGDILHYSMDNLNHHVRKTIAYSDIFARKKIADGRRAGGLTLVFRPWFRFVRGYFLRLGFLDGWQGYVIARMVAFETFLRYTKIHEAQSSAKTDGSKTSA